MFLIGNLAVTSVSQENGKPSKKTTKVKCKNYLTCMQTPMNYILLNYIIIKLAMMVQLKSFGLSVYFILFSLTKL